MIGRRLFTVLAALVLSAFITPALTAARGPFVLHVPVLMYHRIMCQPPDTRPSGLYVCPERFDAEMGLLERHGWHTITADRLAADVAGRICPQRKTFVVTIDDGTLDGYTTAAPILEAHGFRASFAVVVGEMGGSSVDRGGVRPHFDWDQARDLVARGHDIVDHTMLHIPVAGMSQAELDAAVGLAQQTLAEQLGRAPSVFVYPYGIVGGGQVTAYLAARFALAFTTQTGAHESSAQPMFAPRIRVIGRRGASWVLGAVQDYARPCG